LTDSTVLRNLGVPLAHILIALASLEKGLNKVILNEAQVARDLNENYIVISEGKEKRDENRSKGEGEVRWRGEGF
jgi:adenylosuccinate lyase